ncbi:MAG: hypothetical protein K8R34_15955 [Methanosarcinales archaeon]|nr:hypothetical protein [Methanosarcinales archaeon]
MYAQNKNLKLNIIAILVLLIVFTTNATAVTVSVDAPEYESGSRFDITIEIDDVDDLDSGQFDISFDSSVVNVTDLNNDIENGEIGSTAVPIDLCYFIGANSIRLLFNVPGVTGVSGSGTVATIRFEVVGENGDIIFLNLSNGVLVDTKSDKIPANWVNDKVTIGDSPTGTLTTYTTTVYVKNIDDDKLDIHLLVDGNDEDFESISSGKTKEYDDYSLEEGTHTFTIRWFDPDTNEWYEKTKEHTITDVTTIILLTDEHAEDKNKISSHVYINNLDDNNLDIYLYIDENYKKYLSISSGNTGNYGEYEFEMDENALHSFKIEWFDPGTEENYEKISRIYITGEEAVTLYADEHTEVDIIPVHENDPNPVSTSSTLASSSTQSTNGMPSSPATAGGSGMITDTTTQSTKGTPSSQIQVEDSTENNGLEHHIMTTYTLIGFIAFMFALIRIRSV